MLHIKQSLINFSKNKSKEITENLREYLRNIGESTLQLYRDNGALGFEQGQENQEIEADETVGDGAHEDNEDSMSEEERYSDDENDSNSKIFHLNELKEALEQI